MRLLPGRCGFLLRAGGPTPCSVLHRMGFFVPRSLRAGRWAFTPPFHPCPPIADFENRKAGKLAIQALSAIRIPKSAIERRFVFCDTFRRPRFSSRTPACFTRHAALWCSDFPLADFSASDHLSSGLNLAQSDRRRNFSSGERRHTLPYASGRSPSSSGRIPLRWKITGSDNLCWRGLRPLCRNSALPWC